MRRGLAICSVVVFATLGACSAGDGPSGGDGVPAGAASVDEVTVKGAPIRVTVPPTGTSAVYVHSEPNAECFLSSAEADAKGPPVQLFTDSQGDGRLFVQPTKSAGTTSIEMSCHAQGKTFVHSIDVNISDAPTADMPAPVAPAAPARTVRPALTVDEASSINEDELLRRGYPLAPDPESSPAGYAAWLRAVTTPFTVVEAAVEPVSGSRLKHGPKVKAGTRSGTQLSFNWSGAELLSNAGSYGWVEGTWTVPTVTGEPVSNSFSSIWVGIDGDGTNDLVQAGTEQDAVATNFLIFSAYGAWTEVLPQQSASVPISGFPVSPGDEIFVEAWIANPGASPSNLSGSYCSFVLMNLTQSVTAQVNTPRGSTVVGGTSAEWILERPSDAKTLAILDLARYNTASLTGGVARRPNSAKGAGYVNCCVTSSSQFVDDTMVDSSLHNLSTATTSGSAGVNYKWFGFN